MEKTALQEIYEKWHGLKSANEFMVWITENEDRLKAAERDAIVEAAAYGNGRASVDDKKHLGEQYYETRCGSLK